jgi:hypothetical protein
VRFARLGGQSKLLLDSVDSWLLIRPTLVHQRKKSLIPVVRERTQLADSLSRYLLALGLQRVEKESPLWPWEGVSDRQTDQQDDTPNHGGKTDGGPIYNARNSNADVDLERISRPPWFEQKGFAQECFSLTVLRRAKAIMNRVALVKFICRIDDLT